MSPIREHLFTSHFYCSLMAKKWRNFYSNLRLALSNWENYGKIISIKLFIT